MRTRHRGLLLSHRPCAIGLRTGGGEGEGEDEGEGEGESED